MQGMAVECHVVQVRVADPGLYDNFICRIMEPGGLEVHGRGSRGTQQGGQREKGTGGLRPG